MAITPAYREFLEELLAPLGPVGLRRMFGGAGVFYGSTMFGLVVGETLYLKVGDANRPDYDAVGMRPFCYRGRGGREIALSYYELPGSLLDEPDELLDWARKAILVAMDAARQAPAKRRRAAAAGTGRPARKGPPR